MHIVLCSLGDATPIEMMIDSGADANVVSERDWRTIEADFERDSATLYDVTESPKTKLRSYASKTDLHIICTFKAWLEIGDGTKPRMFEKFYVIKGGTRSLLGRKTAMAVKVLSVGLEVNEINVE